VTKYVGPCWEAITICTTTTQSTRRVCGQSEGASGRERTRMIRVGPPVLSRLLKTFKPPSVIEIRACQLQSTHFQFVDRRSQSRLPRRALASVYLFGAIPNGEPKPLPNTGRPHSWTVPSAPEVINDLLSGLYTVANYMH